MSGDLVAAWAGILITAVLSCFSLWIALRSDRRARETHDLDVHRELTRQASQVSAWITYLWNPADEENDRANAVLVQNSSPDAIYDLTVTATMKGRESVMSAGVCPPGRFWSRWNPDNRWDLLSDPAEFETRNWLSRPYTRTDQWVVLSVEFTDSTGTRWRRSGAGGITRLPTTFPT